MSNILSLEELNDAKNIFIGFGLNKNDPEAYNLQISVCETAIEYHRRWQELVNGLNNLPRTNDNDMGWYVPLDSIIRLIDSQK